VPPDLPFIFQIWVKQAPPRPIPEPEEPRGFTFVSHSQPYDLVFRRVGVNAGRCSMAGEKYSPQSHYFVKLDTPSRSRTIIEASQTYNFPTNTTGPRSLSKGEAAVFLNKYTT